MWRGRTTMQTSFTLAQLADPDVAEADKILRACVHCGFCTATCPTYVLLGDELDSPARAHLPDQGHAGERPARRPREVVKHIDRCLSCLACMTTCPSGVHYMHLVDHARAHIEETYRGRWRDRVLRALLASGAALSGAVPRCALAGGRCARPRPFAPLLGAPRVSSRLAAMLRLAPARLPRRSAGRGRRVSGARRTQGPRRAAARLRASRCSRRRSTRRRSGC